MLQAIWITAMIIAALAIGIMLVLVVARLIGNALAARRERRRQALLGTVLSWLDGGTTDEALKAALLRHRSVATSLLIEIFELVRGADQQRLAMIADETDLPRYLRQIVEVGPTPDRIRAAESLVWFPSDETRAILRFVLHDRNADLSITAASALADLGETLPVRRLIEARLDQNRDSSRQLEAVLIKIAPRQTADLIEVAADRSAADRFRAAAIDALARTGSFDLIDTVSSLSRDSSAVVRAAVARSLGVFGHPGAGDTVMRLLADVDWEVRAEAAEAAGRIGLEDAVEPLADLLADENWWVRFRAAAALAGLGERGVGALRRLAAASTDRGGRTAALVLAERNLV
ncbi:MAG TPA: HEAT repeat domain-containing protein [Microvirga sp.]